MNEQQQAAMRQALEALEWIKTGMGCNDIDATITALRQALEQQPAERLELIGHADLAINNIYIFNGYGEEVPEGRTPIYAGYKEQLCGKQN